MKSLNLVLLVTLLISSIPLSLKANPTITQFTCQTLTPEGKIYVNNTNPTTAGFVIRVNRALFNGIYEDVDLQLEFVYRIAGSPDESLGSYNITTSDFGLIDVVERSYLINIPAGRIGGAVTIKYSYVNDLGTPVTYYTTQFFQTSSVPPPAPNLEGRFVRDGSNDKVYFFIGGVWRHVQTVETLRGCWDKDRVWKYAGLIPTNTQGPSPIGDPITPNTSILNHTVTGKVYFQDGNTLRWIPSLAVRDHYKFSFANLRHTNSISGYIIGPDL